MSEADTPKTRSSEEGWATVEFPRAITLETLVRSESEPDPPDDPKDLASAMALVQHLKQREELLSQRVRDLEATVDQLKAALVAPAAESENSEPSNGRPSENRQQLLAETIRKKLEAYQQRIAQIEAEHAQTQQRYQEKTFQLQQVEHTCQELRSRLHRQQRHALQFKAALEKCLEAEAQQRSAPSHDRSSTQFLFSTPPSVEPPSFSLPPRESDPAHTAQPFFSMELEHSQSELHGSSGAEPSESDAVLDAEAFLNASSSGLYADRIDPDAESNPTMWDTDEPDSNAPKKRHVRSNVDLPSFPRLS